MANLNDVITLKLIRYAKTCAWIFGAKQKTSILAFLRFENPFERAVFRFNQFSNFRETTFVRVYWNAILVSRHGMAPHVNQSCKQMRRLIFEVDLG